MDLDALLSRLTLDEKLAQLGCVWCSALVNADGFSPTRAERWLANGMGEITRIGATTGLRPRQRAQLANAIQRYLVDNTRLGIPAIVHEESTAGLCARDATQFPQAIGLASTWDPELVEQIGGVIREQMVATGARHTLAPVLDVLLGDELQDLAGVERPERPPRLRHVRAVEVVDDVHQDVQPAAQRVARGL